MMANGMSLFTVKIGLDVFSLKQEHVSTASVFGDGICEMKMVTELGQQVIQI